MNLGERLQALQRFMYETFRLEKVGLSVCRSVGLSDCQTVSLSVCQTVGLSVCRSVGLSVCWSVGWWVSGSVGLSVGGSVDLQEICNLPGEPSLSWQMKINSRLRNISRWSLTKRTFLSTEVCWMLLFLTYHASASAI